MYHIYKECWMFLLSLHNNRSSKICISQQLHRPGWWHQNETGIAKAALTFKNLEYIWHPKVIMTKTKLRIKCNIPLIYVCKSWETAKEIIKKLDSSENMPQENTRYKVEWIQEQHRDKADEWTTTCLMGDQKKKKMDIYWSHDEKKVRES